MSEVAGSSPENVNPQEFDGDAGPERDAVPDGSRQLGNAASTSPGGGEMGVEPLEDSNRNTNLDRERAERQDQPVIPPPNA